MGLHNEANTRGASKGDGDGVEQRKRFLGKASPDKNCELVEISQALHSVQFFYVECFSALQEPRRAMVCIPNALLP